MPTTLDNDVREQQLHAVTHALIRFRHELQHALPPPSACSPEEQVVDMLVGLLHWCDDRGVCLDLALHEAERHYVDQTGIGPLDGNEYDAEASP
jgi:hypothetical protein